MLRALGARQRPAEARFLTVAHTDVAVSAGQLLLRRRIADDLVRDVAVATQAIVLQDLPALCLHDDRLDEPLRREFLSVPPTVLGFGQVLGDEIVGQMTVDANGNLMVARLLPSVVLWPHDVTIHASLRVCPEVREALRVAERVAADPNGRAQT